MEDFNRLLHDQQLALLQAQFADCGQRRRILREAARAIGKRIAAHPYRLSGIFKADNHAGSRRILSASFA